LIDQDPARYSEDPHTSFEQIYLGADTSPNRLLAETQLARLRKGEKVIGTPVPIPENFNDASGNEISATFGDEFTLALRNVAPGQWNGPVASGLGLHLVRVTARSAPQPPLLTKVRQRVENDWRAGATARAREQAYSRILKGYDVVIEQPK
jgi:hypothetical protein